MFLIVIMFAFLVVYPVYKVLETIDNTHKFPNLGAGCILLSLLCVYYALQYTLTPRLSMMQTDPDAMVWLMMCFFHLFYISGIILKESTKFTNLTVKYMYIIVPIFAFYQICTTAHNYSTVWPAFICWYMLLFLFFSKFMSQAPTSDKQQYTPDALDDPDRTEEETAMLIDIMDNKLNELHQQIAIDKSKNTEDLVKLAAQGGVLWWMIDK